MVFDTASILLIRTHFPLGQGDTSVVSGDSKDEESTFPEDEDSFMFQQALAAARAIHHVQGIEFDETQDINVLTDIKFLVVTVALPLGCE
jgi:hypothetical protein